MGFAANKMAFVRFFGILRPQRRWIVTEILIEFLSAGVSAARWSGGRQKRRLHNIKSQGWAWRAPAESITRKDQRFSEMMFFGAQRRFFRRRFELSLFFFLSNCKGVSFRSRARFVGRSVFWRCFSRCCFGMRSIKCLASLGVSCVSDRFVDLSAGCSGGGGAGFHSARLSNECP